MLLAGDTVAPQARGPRSGPMVITAGRIFSNARGGARGVYSSKVQQCGAEPRSGGPVVLDGMAGSRDLPPASSASGLRRRVGHNHDRPDRGQCFVCRKEGRRRSHDVGEPDGGNEPSWTFHLGGTADRLLLPQLTGLKRTDRPHSRRHADWLDIPPGRVYSGVPVLRGGSCPMSCVPRRRRMAQRLPSSCRPGSLPAAQPQRLLAPGRVRRWPGRQGAPPGGSASGSVRGS